MKILLFGKTGQVGTQFVRQAEKLGDVRTVDRAACDLTNAGAVHDFVLREKPGCIVNAAAYTAVDRAESDEAACFAVNAAAPEAMAKAAAELGIPLVHYSTDYVFNGVKEAAYREDDPTGPLGVYGRTKLEGEQRVAAAGCRFVVLRTSWVYGAEGQNFMRTMLRLGADRPELKIVSDQFGAPTSSRAIAAATVRILDKQNLDREFLRSGIYHMTAAGSTSWFGFAENIFSLVETAAKPKLIPITTSEYPTPAKRPHNSVLCNDKFAAAAGFRMDDWTEMLKTEMVAVAATKPLAVQ